MSTKAIQGKLWSNQPQYWAAHFEPFFMPLYKRTLQHLTLSANDSVLDAGCGSGMFSALAIKTGAAVIGVDAAPGLLEIARKRNPDNSFLEEDLETLPFVDDTFDVVTGFNSFQYAESFEKALSETRRVLKPGGKLVMALWDKPELSDATLMLKAITALLPPPPPGAPSPFELSEDGKVETILKNVGFHTEEKITVACPFLYSNIWEGVKSFSGTAPAANALNYTDQATVKSTIRKALAPFHTVDDFYFLSNHFILFIARK